MILTLGIVKVPISRAKYWRIIILRKSFFPFSKFKLACFFLNSIANVRKPDIQKRGGQSQYDWEDRSVHGSTHCRSDCTGECRAHTITITATKGRLFPFLYIVQAGLKLSPFPPQSTTYKHAVTIHDAINFSSSQVLKYMCCQSQDYQADKWYIIVQKGTKLRKFNIQ